MQTQRFSEEQDFSPIVEKEEDRTAMRSKFTFNSLCFFFPISAFCGHSQHGMVGQVDVSYVKDKYLN